MRALLAVLVLLLCAPRAAGHGGVSMEDDTCIMRIGLFRAHFTGYQPETRATQEFCEDIPELGKAIIVVDFIDKALREYEVEFRVLRDVHDRGKRATLEDLGDARAIEEATLFKLDPTTYPKGTLTFEQRFDQPGWYIGVLSARDGAGHTLTSVFPFQVGVSHPWRYVPAFVLVLVLSLLIYRLTGRNLPASPPSAGKPES